MKEHLSGRFDATRADPAKRYDFNRIVMMWPDCGMAEGSSKRSSMPFSGRQSPSDRGFALNRLNRERLNRVVGAGGRVPPGADKPREGGRAGRIAGPPLARLRSARHSVDVLVDP